ncbi:MAG: hypothetical protein AVDCRST_MAG38-249, partial [uncultured Solirubrobacteraceae bacterium]
GRRGPRRTGDRPRAAGSHVPLLLQPPRMPWIDRHLAADHRDPAGPARSPL